MKVPFNLSMSSVPSGGRKFFLQILFLTVTVLILILANYYLLWSSKENSFISVSNCSSTNVNTMGLTNRTTIDGIMNVDSIMNVTANEWKLSSNNTIRCPDYFKFILEDLAPWKRLGGITLQAVENTQKQAAMRIQILNGKLYIREYSVCFQTRTIFTVWGILQLLQRYPNQIPDVDFMLECEDFPIHLKAYTAFQKDPPLLFRYCTTPQNQEVLWPDFSFWGWPEIKIPNWETVFPLMQNKSSSTPWEERIPLAHWKGAVGTAEIRKNVFKCHDPAKHEWGVDIFDINWDAEVDQEGSKLENQCTHRYKIYMEGRSWSCSLKYILACASTVLYIKSPNYDYFSRALKEYTHFIPVELDGPICETLKDAVSWSESNPALAKAIGLAGSEFVEKELSMEKVYEYMFHLLRYYHSLQRFQPVRAPNSVHITIKSVLRDHEDYLHSFFGPPEKPAPTEPCFFDF